MAKNKIVYASYIFSDDDETLRNGNEYQITSLIADELQADTIELEVKCNNKDIVVFTENAPLQYYRENLLRSTYYVQSIKQIGDNKYTISADSAMGLLMKRLHAGGIYTGQTVKEVTNEICGNVPVLVKTVFSDTKLYGWLPYCKPPKSSARNNLAQVLYAIGAALTTDNNGVLRVEPLWDGTSSSIGETRLYFDGSVETEKPVSAVTVTEHQYIAGTDEKELFSGTSQQGDIITFSEPMHSLTATGFTILESGANYAKISSGSGSLKGKTYIHNTRLVTQTVTENAAENVKSVTDATLVSLVNSSAVAKRLADYYKCRETITNGIVSGQEKPGHVVSVYHPYDKKMVSACIVSLDTTMSGTLKSEMAALVGFLPPQPETTEYYDERVLLTGSGEWTVPEGVTTYTRVLIDPGQGGKCGKPGSLPTSKITQESSAYDGVSGHKFTKIARGFLAKDLPPAPGGDPGEPGEGGKFLIETIMDAVPGTKIAYSCGVGGEGAPYEEDSDAAGSYGTHTTMGGSSADSGSSNPNGYTDFITGDTFAAKGAAGTPGGDGVGYDSAGNVVRPADIVVNGVSYTAGEQGTPDAEDEFGESYNYGHFEARSKGAHGGGPAYKSNGNNGGPGIPPTITGSVNYIYVRGGNQGVGATAMPPEKAAGYGTGGTGGNGGGGNGQTAWGTYASCTKRDDAQATQPVLNVVPSSSSDGRGLGSAGGQGADGCILIYYRKLVQNRSGPLVQRGGGLLFDRLKRLLIV